MTLLKGLTIAAATVIGTAAYAPPLPSAGSGIFAGFVWSIGGGAGLTVKYVSSREINTPALSAGVSYYFDNGWGADLGLVYNTCTLSGTVGYDFLQNGLQFGIGALTDPYCFGPT